MFVFFILARYDAGKLGKLDFRLSGMERLESTTFVDVFAMQRDLRTVGELYDFLCERGLSEFADFILK